MKNLKRALSFSLASVMLVGTMAVSAGAADYNDADKIQHTEAVNTLTALNVINGKDNGNYDPTGIVTRAEMAKLITLALNGGKDPVIGTKVNPTFSDIKGHWAESYIEYCVNLGIISGRGDGSFDPNGTVTGNEAAKMMLVAMGWDSTIFKFTGANWALNVGVEANKIKLFEDLAGMDPSAGLSRDNTAQLVYNGIVAPIMEKSPNMTITNGEITWNYFLSENKSLFTEKFSGKVWIGTFTGNDKTTNGLEKGSIRVNGKLETAEANAGTTNADFPSDLDISNIGEEVKVLFKDGTSGNTNRPDKRDTIYGVFNTGATNVITGTKGDVKDQKSTDAKLNIGGVKYDTADTVTVITNYNVGASETKNAKDGNTNTNSALTTALKASSGDTIKAVTDPNTGKIETVYVTEYKLGVVTAVNKDKVTLSGVGAISSTDNTIYNGIAKDDVVVYTKLYSTVNDNATFTVTKAESVQGTLNGYKSATNVVIDQTTYGLLNGTLSSQGLTGKTPVTDPSNQIGEKFTGYLANGYVGLLFKESTTQVNYGLVLDVQAGNLGDEGFQVPKVQLLLANGSKVTANIHKDSVIYSDANYVTTTKLTNGQAINKTQGGQTGSLEVGQLVEYSEVTSGVYKITEVGTYKQTQQGGVNYVETVYDKNTKTFDKVVVGSDGVLFAKLNDEYKVYKLRDLGNVKTKAGAATYYGSYAPDGKVVAAYAELDTRPSGASAEMFYGIVSSYVGVVKSGNVEYNKYAAENQNETVDVLVAKNTPLTVGSLIGMEKTNDSIYTVGANGISVYDGTTYNSTNGLATWAKEYSEADGTLTYWKDVTGNTATGYQGGTAGADTKALNKDYVVVYVDTENNKAGDEIGIGSFDSVTGYQNVLLVADTDNTTLAVFVETSGKAGIIPAGIPLASTANAATVNNALASSNVTIAGDYDLDTNNGVTLTNNTLHIQGAVTATNTEQVARPMDAAVGTVAAPAPFVTMTSGTVNAFNGNTDLSTLLAGKPSTSLAIYRIDLGKIAGVVADTTQVKLNNGNAQTLTGDTFYDLIVGNKTASATFQIAKDGDFTNTANGNIVTMTVTFPGW